MTNRYDLMINAINLHDGLIVQMFLFSLLAVVAYPVLDWVPLVIRHPSKMLYLAFMLGVSIFLPVYSWLM